MLCLDLMDLFPTLLQVLSHSIVTSDLVSEELYLLLFIFHYILDKKLPVADLANGPPGEIIALGENPSFSPAPEAERQGAEIAILGVRNLFVFDLTAVAFALLLVGGGRVSLRQLKNGVFLVVGELQLLDLVLERKVTDLNDESLFFPNHLIDVVEACILLICLQPVVLI